MLDALWRTRGTQKAVKVPATKTLYEFFRAYVYSMAKRRNLAFSLRRRRGFLYCWVEPRRP